MESTAIKMGVSVLKITTMFCTSGFSPKYQTAFWTSLTAVPLRSTVDDQPNDELSFYLIYSNFTDFLLPNVY